MAVPRPLILIPSYNTGPILLETVRSAIALGIPTWVVFDGSTDGSPATIRHLETVANPHFRIIELPANGGKGAAVLHGLRLAIDAGFTHVLTMDADGQHPASQVPEFLEIAAAHPEAAGDPAAIVCVHRVPDLEHPVVGHVDGRRDGLDLG